MHILKRITVPTGDILVVQGAVDKFECLMLGDYGKDVNLKSDALGLTREIEKVRHTALLPLTEKCVCTISTQSTCQINCSFCNVPRVKPRNRTDINATFDDLCGQILMGLSIHPELTWSKRLNVHFARMGEPTFNTNVLNCAEWLHTNFKKFNPHPVVSTMMPRDNIDLAYFINKWMFIKNILYEGNAGLQLSINSTDERERYNMFHGNALTLHEISKMISGVCDKPVGRKITLNFAIANYTIDPSVLLGHFDPEDFIIKLTPMHRTETALIHNIKTEGDYTTFYPYKQHEENLKRAGYDVLVFIASHEEDMGRITCGNAILAGTNPEVPHTVTNY